MPTKKAISTSVKKPTLTPAKKVVRRAPAKVESGIDSGALLVIGGLAAINGYVAWRRFFSKPVVPAARRQFQPSLVMPALNPGMPAQGPSRAVQVRPQPTLLERPQFFTGV